MNEMTQRGIAALKAGDRATARKILQAAVKLTPDDATAWLWLSGAVENDDERVAILRHVQRIDPGNKAAARGLSQVLARNPQSDAAALKQAPTGDPDNGTPAPLAGPPEAEQLDTAPASESSDITIASPIADSHPGETNKAAAVLAAKRRKKEADDSVARTIFRTRPSLVQALATFWLFFFGILAIGFVLLNTPGLSEDTIFIFTLVFGVVFELIVLYVVIRRYRTRYELTTQQLILPFRKHMVKIPLADIFGVECQQSLIQKILSIGDINIDTVAEGELTRLRMREVPDCRKRTDQILSLLQDPHN